jgi:type IV pilus assembly protein PilC
LAIEGEPLPILFRQLVIVGEQTGHLPEIFGELADYYELQRKLRRDFIAQITWPVIQFAGGVFVIALLIYILGIIGSAPGKEPIAPIGFGLRGTSGAITFLLAVGLFLGSIAGAYWFFTRGMRGRAAVEGFLLGLPAIGPCASAFALGRFCLALRMTLETGMPTPQALRQSLRATGNAAFARHEDFVAARIKAGDEMHEALNLCPAFPTEFREILEVAEVSGQIPETMIRQGEHYREEAARRLKTLGKLAGWGVYLFVAILIIWAIFRIASLYFGMLGG